MKGIRVAIVLAACALGVTAAADEDRELARAHFKAGKVYFNRGEFARALQEFKNAKAAADLPELDFNIARAYEETGDAAHAARYFEKYLQARPHADDADETRDALVRLRRRVGYLHISSEFPDAQLALDGETLEGPERVRVAVTEGPHIVTASSAGVVVRTASAQARAGAEVTVTLAAEAPLLATTPRPAAVPERSRRGLWIGLAVGGAVVVAVVAIVLGVTLTRSTDFAAQARSSCQAPCMVFQFK